MISAICVYNNEIILNNYLLKSLKNQTVDYELITLDNTHGKFKSAAEALNYGGRRAKGNYLMFVHQDVDFCSDKWLEEAEEILDNLPNLGIAGVAGKKDGKGVISIIKHDKPPRLVGEIQIENIATVQTLDELMVIIPKKVFVKLQFDENTCDNWHLYAVDYCLSIKKLGFNVYLIPMYAYHRSPGQLSDDYYNSLKKVLQKHRKDYKLIYTTVGDWNTLYPLNIQKQKFWRLAKKITQNLSKNFLNR